MEEPQAVQFEADFNQFSAFEDNNDTQIKSEEVEDEFDDFQDFTSAPALKSQDSELFPPYVPDTTNISERITSIIKIMFPEDSTPAENVEPVVKLGPSSMIINPVDSALALEFQWNKSEMRHFLMKSIGIDIRGADLHENWNPSMPRFAANLGAVPLEPLKPVKTDISQANPMPINEATNLQVVDPAKVSDIPVVEFNLNRFSTDNPLDGSKESNNSKQTEEIYSTQLSKSINEQPEQELQITDTSIATQFGPPISKSIPTATSIIAKQQVKPEAELNNDFGLTVGLEHEDPAAATSTTYSGAFKETHIFTPAKIESITRSQAKTKSPIDFDFETAAAGIIIDEKVINKEYRDVEYKPPTPPPKSQPASVLTIDDDFSDFQSVSVVHAKQPVIGQKVKELESRTSTPNDMILSPAVLLPQSVRLEKHKNSKIEWPEPGLNSDEMARFEQIFSKPIEGSSIEEDEWCDFVSNTESMPHITPSANTYQDDEWSEFVSSAPATAQPQFNSGAWQNANYYNNPLSVYSSTHSNFVPNENNNNISMIMGSTPNYKHSQSQDQTQAATLNKNQFLNYNKVVPSISLIPDLGFVAPPTVSSGRFLNNFQNSNIPRQ
ncbi:AFTPH family protein [Megaselia abdita]